MLRRERHQFLSWALIAAMATSCQIGAGHKTVTLPEGAELVASLESPLRSDANNPGDTFVAATREPIRIGESIAVPAGSKILGTVSSARPAGRTEGRAHLALRFNAIELPGGTQVPIEAKSIDLLASSDSRKDVQRIIGGGVAGVILGGIAGGTKGAAIGGVLGAGTGTAVALATKGKEIVLPAGQRIVVRIVRSVQVPVVTRATA